MKLSDFSAFLPLAEQFAAQVGEQEAVALATDQYHQKHETDAATLANDTLGAFKHFLRGRVGWLVDLFWSEPAVQQALAPIAQAAAGQVIAAAVSNPPLTTPSAIAPAS